MVVSYQYEFKTLDRLRSVCVVPKDDIFILLNSKESIKFSFDYPKYIYMHCTIETLGVIDKHLLNTPGVWVFSNDDLIFNLISFLDTIFESYSLLDFSDIFIYSLDVKIKPY